MKRSQLRTLWIIVTFLLLSLTSSVFNPDKDNQNPLAGFLILLEITVSVILFKRIAGSKRNYFINFKKNPAGSLLSPNYPTIEPNKVYKDMSSNNGQTYEEYKGRLGEDEIGKELLRLTYPNRLLRNLLIGNETQTHEIDLICITQVGIYVIESKNYKGWIFGNSDSKNWTQTFQNQTKNQFYNPILQNQGHINHLEKLVKKHGTIDLFSLIVFSDNAVLKSTPKSTNEIMILNTNEVSSMLNDSIAYNRKLARGLILTQEQIESIWDDLYQYSIKSQEDLDNHLSNVRIYQQ